jgi:hypothetical protein
MPLSEREACSCWEGSVDGCRSERLICFHRLVGITCQKYCVLSKEIPTSRKDCCRYNIVVGIGLGGTCVTRRRAANQTEIQNGIGHLAPGQSKAQSGLGVEGRIPGGVQNLADDGFVDGGEQRNCVSWERGMVGEGIMSTNHHARS